MLKVYTRKYIFIYLKKITNNDFILAIKNCITGNSIKSKKIKRRDFISRTLIELAYQIQTENFNWINYENFKSTEQKIIMKETNILEANILNDIINSINEIEQSNNQNSNNNNDGDAKLDSINEHEEIKENDFTKVNKNLAKSKDTNNNDNISDYSESDENIEEDDENDLEVNGILDSILQDKKKKTSLLFDRLIKLDSFNNYEDILNDLIKKRNMKRLKVTGEDEDDLKFEKLSNKKQKKIRYPKK